MPAEANILHHSVESRLIFLTLSVVYCIWHGGGHWTRCQDFV